MNSHGKKPTLYLLFYDISGYENKRLPFHIRFGIMGIETERNPYRKDIKMTKVERIQKAKEAAIWKRFHELVAHRQTTSAALETARWEVRTGIIKVSRPGMKEKLWN